VDARLCDNLQRKTEDRNVSHIEGEKGRRNM
jgi:hypothetical protein